MTLRDKLAAIQRKKNTLVCVGLDPDPANMPPYLLAARPQAEAIVEFNRAIIQATAPHACAFKLNFAFFEALGAAGWQALETTLSMIPDDVISIADAKRGDIGNSGKFYAKSIFETLLFDTCTVSPYMGMDSVAPFLAYEDRLAFVLARTSNPGAADLQEKIVDGAPLYDTVVRRLSEQPSALVARTGLVVGATDAAALKAIRERVPAMPFLIPGVGAQGGDTGEVIRSAYAGPGTAIVNSSRAILYADASEAFAEAAAREAEKLKKELNRHIPE